MMHKPSIMARRSIQSIPLPLLLSSTHYLVPICTLLILQPINYARGNCSDQLTSMPLGCGRKPKHPG